jgi:hypothetical protein
MKAGIVYYYAFKELVQWYSFAVTNGPDVGIGVLL